MRLLKISALALACGAAAYALPSAQAAWGGFGHGGKGFKEHFCSDQKFSEKFAEAQAKRADRLAERLKLTDAQKAAFKEVQDLRAKNFADRRAAICAAKPESMTFEQKLEKRQARLQARLDAVKAEAPKLIAFYKSLDDHQKGQFDEISGHMGRHHGWGHHGGMMGGMMGHHGGQEMGPHDGE